MMFTVDLYGNRGLDNSPRLLRGAPLRSAGPQSPLHSGKDDRRNEDKTSYRPTCTGHAITIQCQYKNDDV